MQCAVPPAAAQATHRSFVFLQSTMGSLNPPTWPLASQILGDAMIDESKPTMSSRRVTKCRHHAALMLLRSSTPSGP